MKISEYHDSDAQQVGTVSQAPTTKFIQICASQNDLFALDEGGNIFQYNFNTKAWLELVASRSYEGHAQSSEHTLPRHNERDDATPKRAPGSAR